MRSVTLKGREIPLVYTTYEMKVIQEDIARPMDRAISLIMGRNPDNKEDMSMYAGPEHLDAAAKLIRILGNAGLEEAGEAPDLTDRKVLRAIRPGDLSEMISACMDAMAEGMRSEIPDRAEEGPVDVTLEEMNKKKERES